MKLNKTEIIVMDSLNSLILGNTPQTDKLDIFELADKIIHKNINYEENGLFDSVNPNFNNYYPDVTAEDLVMDDKDFIFPIYRALSETIVNGNYTDFSKNNALKASMSKLKNQTVYVNHDMIVGAHVGVITDVRWSESYTNNKLVVPAGINAKLKVDIKSNPNLARGIMMDPPAIHSVSATLQFAWEKSHPKMTDEEFWTKMGTPGPDKAIVSKIVTEILKYYELSFVSHGADPYAKKIGEDGKLLPENLAKQFSRNSLDLKPTSYHFFSFRELGIEQNNITIPNSDKDNEKTEIDMDITKLANTLKLTGDQTEETIMTHLTDLIANADKAITAEQSLTTTKNELEAEKLKVADLGTQLTTAKNEATTNKAAADKYTGMIAKLRADVLANYVKLKADTKDEAIVNLIGSADYDTLLSLDKDYTAQLEAKFPLTCKDCNSHNVDRGTAKAKDADPIVTPKTSADIHREQNTVKIHG